MHRTSSRTPRKISTPKRSRNRRRFLITLVFFLCSAIAITSTAWISSRSARAAQEDPGISPEALAQIEALIREKESRTETEKKLDSQLIYEAKMERGEAIADGVRRLDTDVPYTYDGRTVVDITANVSDHLLMELSDNGAEILETVADRNSVRVAVPLVNLEAIAALPDVKFVQPRQDAVTSGITRSNDSSGASDPMPGKSTLQFSNRATRVRALLSSALDGSVGNVAGNIPPTGQGSQTSEGDATHRAFAARGTFHADGTGIKIGVLSDGVTSLAASQAAGDLGPVTVLPGQQGASGDEGTAMLEIVHDIAPGAQLYFATGFTSITSMAQNIRDLRTAGCDIIIDDVFYFVETPFQDGQLNPTNTNGGVVIQAVNDVTTDGAMYFSSAGNSGNKNDGTSGVWEGDFVDGGAIGSPVTVGRVHRFGTQNFNVLTAASTNPISLYWSDPLGGSTNDYDLFRLNAAGTAVASSSTNIQNGSQDPYEQVTQNISNPRIVIVKKAAAAARFLHLNTNRGQLQISTAGATHGHSAAENAFSCAASPARLPFGAPPNPVGPFPNPFGPTDVTELFSSDGPRRVFFQADKTPYTPGNFSSTGGVLRQKPDITAADGVSVTGAGNFPSPFYGTSAAAPHAGAIAALLKSANPSFTNAQIRAALISTAIDIEGAGVDRDSGAGVIMPYNAFQALGVEGTANLAFGAINANEDPGNANGTMDAGEGARVDIQLQNLGVVDATGISATLTTSTPGVTVHTPNTSVYPNLAAGGGNSFNLSPFRFTLASNVPCPLLVHFTLTVNYTGGPSPKVLTFTVQTGSTLSTASTTLDTTAPTVPAGFTTAITGTQNGRINRFLPPSSCGVDKANPGLFTNTGVRRFDAYTFTACNDSCVTMSIDSGAGSVNLYPVVYKGAFDPANLTTNYYADPGSSNSGTPFSFNVTTGQTYTIVVHEVNPGGGIGNNYIMNFLGCMVNCEPPNQVPVAKAKNVTVTAGPDCKANASVDDGSFDPDGDPLVITQSPAGPYPLGATSVQLTVTDSHGASSQASATVTVVDSSGPDVSSVTATPNMLWPPNHQMVPIQIDYNTSDTCSSGGRCVLSVASNEPTNGLGDGDTSPDWSVVDEHNVMLRSERAGGGSGRIYTITIDCTDGAGNHSTKTVTVSVSGSQSGNASKSKSLRTTSVSPWRGPELAGDPIGYQTLNQVSVSAMRSRVPMLVMNSKSKKKRGRKKSTANSRGVAPAGLKQG
jgi:subtilase family protein